MLAFVSCFFWMQITVGLTLWSTYSTGLGIYPDLLALGMYNTARAAGDAALGDRARKMIGALEHLTAEQLLSYGGVFFGTAVGALLWYRKNYQRPPVDARRVAEDLVLTSGVIGDMGPVREAAASLREMAAHMNEVVDESRKLRHVLEQMHERLERNAELQIYVERHRSDR